MSTTDGDGMGRLPFSSGALASWVVGVTAVVLVPAFVAGPFTGLVPFLVFLPAFVAGMGTVRQTAFAWMWVLVVVVGVFAYRDELGGNPLSVLFVAGFGGLAVAASWYRTRKEEEIDRLRSAVAALQRRILRPLPLSTGQVEVDGLYWPVEEDSMVGGDVYEVVETRYGTRVLIADVQGKGMPAVGAAFAVLEMFRVTAYGEPDLSGLVGLLEDAVVRQNAFAEENGEPERFVTALVLDIDDTGEVRVVNCGHVPPHVLRGGRAGQVPLAEASVPLGLGGLIPEPRAVERFDLPPDAVLLLCTDGVTEARDPAGSFYPLEERLGGREGASPARVVRTLEADLRDFTASAPRDDIAVLALARRTAPGPSA
ncbi:PP2C family protein-serine/threonine phosphatase [Actinorugispora endophytica]|uniref:Stage II sporulation protein E n=1 Tax=Actinorugispora endophytica TaxID=1605990 RepID=A0A4R6V0Y3_9ACTN|nr:PP2C family protein-serine/threonine phosphatase [Actinorugispora endophytica]TDQ52285.1 stage II sporulation protein E [Actinorugispora endophytica]